MHETLYTTSDLHLSAYLMLQPSVKFRGLQSMDGNKKNFIFSPLKRCQKLASDFTLGAEVNVRHYCDSLRMAKDVLFGHQRGEFGPPRN